MNNIATGVSIAFVTLLLTLSFQASPSTNSKIIELKATDWQCTRVQSIYIKGTEPTTICMNYHRVK